MEPKALSIRVIHHPKMAKRKRYLDKILQDYVDVKFITAEYEAPHLLHCSYTGGNEESWNNKFRILYPNASVYRLLITSEINNAISHRCAIDSFRGDWCLIIEDDAVFGADFERFLTENPFPENADIVYLGGGFDQNLLLKNIKRFGRYISADHPCTNTCVAYAISKSAGRRVANELNSFDGPIDYELAFLQYKLSLNVYHASPYVVHEGSKFLYASSIRPHATMI
jgi:GR25 family glycosyltransferase involved in LPS biosynthesis